VATCYIKRIKYLHFIDYTDVVVRSASDETISLRFLASLGMTLRVRLHRLKSSVVIGVIWPFNSCNHNNEYANTYYAIYISNVVFACLRYRFFIGINLLPKTQARFQ
jgi:hypothetical protein